ncbi:MAG: hypothetical protein VYC57_07520 [Verrucomicrobiota bacterium]|nr:hypothetical protein [Verrucomicrobiota bacterium]
MKRVPETLNLFLSLLSYVQVVLSVLEHPIEREIWEQVDDPL